MLAPEPQAKLSQFISRSTNSTLACLNPVYHQLQVLRWVGKIQMLQRLQQLQQFEPYKVVQ